MKDKHIEEKFEGQTCQLSLPSPLLGHLKKSMLQEGIQKLINTPM